MKDINVKYFKKLYIGKSSVAGEGLFAGEKINKDEVILSFGGTLALQKDRYSGKYLSSTFVGITEDIMLCETSDSEKDFSDYINHSCDPNVGMFDCINVIAIKDIIQGEEILCDYSFWEADISWVMKTQCNCSSDNCRSQITGKDWEKVSPQDKKFMYYAPFLKRRIINNNTNTE